MDKNLNLNNWTIFQGDYQVDEDYEKAFKAATLKEKTFNNIMLFLFFLCGSAIILFSSMLVSKI
jgi:hypothetical protein